MTVPMDQYSGFNFHKSGEMYFSKMLVSVFFFNFVGTFKLSLGITSLLLSKNED